MKKYGNSEAIKKRNVPFVEQISQLDLGHPFWEHCRV
jgi:hypothetical protein